MFDTLQFVVKIRYISPQQKLDNIERASPQKTRSKKESCLTSITKNSLPVEDLIFNRWTQPCLLLFRLADSIPKSTVRYYKAKLEWLRDQLRRVEKLAADDESDRNTRWLGEIEKLNREWFIKCEDNLHKERVGPTWMRDPRIADKVSENLHRLNEMPIA